MKLEKYDRIIWRTIGTLLLLGLVGGLASTALLSTQLFRGTRHEHDVVRANPESKKSESLSLGYFDPLLGTDLILIPLTADASFELEYSSRANGGRIRNFMLYNERTKASNWIWKEAQTMMLEPQKVFDQVAVNATKKTLGLIFTKISTTGTDTRAPKSILYYDLAGEKLFTVCENVDRIVGTKQIDGKHLLAMYVRAGKGFVRDFDIKSLSAGPETELAIPQ